MKKLPYLLLWGILAFAIVSCSKSKNINPLPDDDNDNQEVVESGILYVSPYGSGTKSGESIENPADFLSNVFWDNVRKKLLKEPVTVQFKDGEYGRAYSEKPLVLERIGHPDHKLLIKGGDGVIFTLDEGVKTKSSVVDVRGAQNIIIDGFHFTGNGSVNYVLRFTKLTTGGIPTTNIILQNSSFIDMEGIIYGASGCSYKETNHIVYLNNTFKRIGAASTAHMIYNAYGSDHIYVINSHFEDCMGDYVRFRDDCDYGIVKGSTFLKSSDKFSGAAFISMPLFNSVAPEGNEYFATNYSFTDNKFTNSSFVAIGFAMKYHLSGFSPPEWHYLLTKEEGTILTAGADFEKKKLLLENFGIDTDKIRVNDNEFSSRINSRFALTTNPAYGAVSKGFSGTGEIYQTINKSADPFSWEP